MHNNQYIKYRDIKGDESMSKKAKRFWGGFIILLILLAYIIPFTILTNVQTWYGSFLFWGIIGVLIIFANVMVTRDWRE